MFAILGTVISIFFTGINMYLLGYLFGFSNDFQLSLAFGSLISATDPVSILSIFKVTLPDANFYHLLFGESILNDAISIVFYETVLNYQSSDSLFKSIVTSTINFFVVFIGSVIIGFLIGYFTAFVVI